MSIVCGECGTSDTPLWRYGPNGSKSLCNACGIRWKRLAQKKEKKLAVQHKTNEKKVRGRSAKLSTTIEPFLPMVVEVVKPPAKKPEPEPKAIHVPSCGAGKALMWRPKTPFNLEEFLAKLEQ